MTARRWAAHGAAWTKLEASSRKPKATVTALFVPGGGAGARSASRPLGEAGLENQAQNPVDG
jgi:hypothetical protein